MANDPLPMAQRPPRIAAPEREVDELRRIEEVLVIAAIAVGEPGLALGTARDRVRSQDCGQSFARRLIKRKRARRFPASACGSGTRMMSLPRRMSAAGGRRHPGAEQVGGF